MVRPARARTTGRSIRAGSEPVDILSYGEPLVAMYPREPAGGRHGGQAGSAYRMTWGGDTSNLVLAASRLGRRCAYLTRIGPDPFAERFLELWQSRDVETALVQRDETHNTGVYFVTFEGIRHTLTYYRRDSAAANVRADLVDWDRVREARVLHLSGISQAISTAAADLSFQLMRFAREHGILVSYDVNYRPPLWPAARADALTRYSIAEFADILFVTDEEIGMLGWPSEPGELRRAFGRPLAWLAIKQGPDGAVAMDADDRPVSVGAFDVEVADTVGAGDAFDAAFIDALLDDRPLEEATRYACAVSALVCRGTGPLETQPARAEVDAFLSRTGGVRPTTGGDP